MTEIKHPSYDCAVIGGGLSGLCLSIQLAQEGFTVIVFEKNSYPAHKVCGEYISMESWDFLTRLGVPLESMNLPVIDQLGVSSPGGYVLNHTLKLGGFGISRYTLEEILSKIAVERGVTLLENCRVNGLTNNGLDLREIHTTKGIYSSRIICGSYGKYAPSFVEGSVPKSGADRTNYIGVKYHVKADLPENRIELHNFKDGYCGISKVDGDKYCLCYLTTAQNLLESGKEIRRMEEQILYQNRFLKKYFTTYEFIDRNPLVISNIGFAAKVAAVDGMFLLGDAAGTISPLCGNGMSMGMRASQLLAAELFAFLNEQQSYQETLENYRLHWEDAFQSRITVGSYIQSMFGKKIITEVALRCLNTLPGVTNMLVGLTHGSPF